MKRRRDSDELRARPDRREVDRNASGTVVVRKDAALVDEVLAAKAKGKS